jgi:murein DD-endopeptidase MepM/ murein hydrolase activator NlpD
MNQTLARSILVLFATSALGACATPTYATSLPRAAPQDGEPAATLVRAADSGPARLTPAVERGEDPGGLVLAATHRRHHATARKASEDPGDPPATYTVRKGDTLAKIAGKLGVGLAELKTANHIKGTSIDVGQVLKVPGAASTKTSTKASGRRAAAAAADEDTGDQPASYKVRKGDTLAKVAARLGVSVAELKQANHIKRASIHAGQVLKVPGKAAVQSASRGSRAERAAAPETPTTYKVRHGDTLFSIAKRFGVSVEDLRAANGLGKRASLHTGQTLKLAAAEAVQDEAPVRGSKASARRRAAEAEADMGEGGQAAGRVVQVPGAPATYRVRKGDTLDKVADKLGTDVARLKKDNRLKGSTIRPGQVLKGPRTASKPAYVARSGDTLADIGRRFGVSAEKLRAANGLSRRARIRSGEKIVLPVGYRDHGAVATPVRERERTPPLRFTPLPLPSAAAPAPSDDQPQSTAPAEGPSTTTPPAASTPRPYTPTPSGPRSYAPPATTNGPPLAPTSAPPPTDAQISELGRGHFQWPLKGQILSDFGPKTPGQRNDGINIQAGAGDPVLSAAAGDVVYAGDQVPGYGNLVLVKHADGWVTAYGHLSKVEVKMQQKVAQGQEIGQAGTTGGVTEPQVHFEVRYAPNPLERARPIDPKLVLPR